MNPTSLGVIVGRFQVHELSDGHLELINEVVSRHKNVIILLGSTPGVLVTRNSPLDFQTRRVMINEDFPGITVLPLRDMPSDEDWSRSLDDQIKSIHDIGTVMLYGSRDSFLPAYSGRYDCTELPTTCDVSGTMIRNSLSNEIRASRDFRHGVVYAAFNRYPTAYATVDIALLREDQVALVRQASDPAGLWRFPGGFVDPDDHCLEYSAARELREELEVAPGVEQFRYIGSRRQDSFRYRNELDGITTTFFAAPYQFGPLVPGDDAVDAKWFCVESLPLIPEHEGLGQMLQSYLNKETP